MITEKDALEIAKFLVERGYAPKKWDCVAVDKDGGSVLFMEIDAWDSNKSQMICVTRADLLSLPCEECGGTGKEKIDAASHCGDRNHRGIYDVIYYGRRLPDGDLGQDAAFLCHRLEDYEARLGQKPDALRGFWEKPEDYACPTCHGSGKFCKEKS